VHYLPASLLPWPLGCIQRLLPCKRCRVGPCCTSPKPTQSVRSPLRDWHEPRLAYLRQPESRAGTTQGPRRSMMLSTSFKSIRCAFPCVAAAPRPRERGTARGMRERPCPSCACSVPAPGRSPRSRRGRRAHLADRVQVFPGERENVGQEGFDALVHRAVPPSA
jgi:hypothetical protein